MKSTSAWAMRSRYGLFLLVLVLWLTVFSQARAVVLERVVALVGNTPVFYSELLAFRQLAKERGTYRSDGQTLEALIERRLLELEARRLRLDAGVSDRDALVDRYLELAVRGSLIRTRLRGQMIDREGGESEDGEDPLDRSAAGTGTSMGDAESREFEEALDRKIQELRERYEVRIIPYD